MKPPVFHAPPVSPGEVRAYISEAKELEKGTKVFDQRGVMNPARFQNKLFAEVKGSEGEMYKVSLAFTDIPRTITAACTCPAGGRQTICKHAVALLIAWSRVPESFVVSDKAPSTGSVKVKEGKSSPREIMKGGVEQVITLVRELGTAGVAVVGKDRVAQIHTLGESMKEHRLHRLSADIVDLASLLAPSTADSAPGNRAFIPSSRYTDLLADILLTAKKLEKHLAGEPLDERYVEELIGKVWKPSELKPFSGLCLVEIAYQRRDTSDGLVIRESRFIDVKSGAHYSERQVVPLAEQGRHAAKRSYATSVIEGAGCVYPGFPPLRITLDRIRDEKTAGPDVIAALIEAALPDVGSALAALQEHRRDVFAPDLLPVSVRVDTLFARGSRIEAVDAKGHALHLPDDPSLEERLGAALRDGRLVALLGDVGIDAALPVIRPLAAIVEGPFGAELRTLEEPAGPKRARRGLPSLPISREPSSWASVARLAGVSEATIILGELREELADRLVAGLAGLGSRAIGSVVTRLRDLELGQLAAIAESCAARTEASERLIDFIKLYRGISHALVRLAGATYVERETLERVPTYESVFVRRPAARLDPPAIKKRGAEGALNRYEAAVHFARYYEALPPEELSALSTHIYTAWTDGSTGPYVARAFAGHGPLATDAAERVLSSPSGRVARMTAVRVLQAAGGPTAEEVLRKVVEGNQDVALRALAEDALDTIDLNRGQKDAVKRRRASRDKRLIGLVKELLTASKKEERCAAIEALVELGHRGALPALRRAYAGDATHAVREDAAYALARLGDTEMVDAFLTLLRARQEHELREQVEVALRALGKLGDVRALPELLNAYEERHYVAMVADAIRELGAAALAPLLDRIEARPELAGGQAVRNILQNIPAEELGRELIRRFSERASGVGIGQEAHALAERATLLLKLADAQEKSRRLVAKAICDRLSASENSAEKTLVKLAERALGLR